MTGMSEPKDGMPSSAAMTAEFELWAQHYEQTGRSDMAGSYRAAAQRTREQRGRE